MTRGRATLRLLVALAFLALAGAVFAQVTPESQPRYDDWLATASRAEAVIDAGRASTAALEDLRSDLAEFRQDFVETRDKNSARIATLQSQLDALGPKPESGDEAADIATLRANLDTQLAELRVPAVVSQEAFSRANGLISEIDRIIRERQTNTLLARGPTPLNPVYWPQAALDLTKAARGLSAEVRRSWNNRTERAWFLEILPVNIVLVILGLVLLVRGRVWSRRLGDYLGRRWPRGTGVLQFMGSVLAFVLRLLAVILLVTALTVTELVGVRGAQLLEALPGWAITLLGFDFLASRLYAKRDDVAIVQLQPERRAEMRAFLRFLGLLLVASFAVELLEQIETISAATRAVIAFPGIVLTSLTLLRMRQIAVRDRQDLETNDDETVPRATLVRLMPLVRNILTILAVAAPVLAALGYGSAAEAAIYPAVLTLALFGGVTILQRLAGDLYAWWSPREEASSDSLFPVLAGFVIALLSLPLLALIWGARVADLTELWTRFLEGFEISGTRISPTDFLTFAVIFAVAYTVTRIIQGTLRNNLLPKTSLDPGGQNALVSGVGYVGVFLSAILAITGAGIDLSSLAIVAGALSVGIGFGLQNIVSNFVSGIILLVERPISEGDWIEVGGQMGYVRDISVRSTRIETFDRSDVIVPNSDLVSGTVTNYTRGNTVGRVIVAVGVAYGSDTRRIEAILREIASAHPMVLVSPPPNVVFQGFGADALHFEIRAILRDVNWSMAVKSDMNHEIAKRFAEEGIEIPFGQRDIWLRNPEALKATLKDGEA